MNTLFDINNRFIKYRAKEVLLERVRNTGNFQIFTLQHSILSYVERRLFLIAGKSTKRWEINISLVVHDYTRHSISIGHLSLYDHRYMLQNLFQQFSIFLTL